MLELAEAQGPKIKVIGVGGGGGNAVNTMIEADVQGVEFVAVNTDCQVLETNQATTKIQIGKNLTKGLGAGANPDIGCAAALEDSQRIGEVLAGADMVFVTAGMGGGTGTGAAPVIARTARELGALTVGVVTKPFVFEGLQRKKKAAAGIAELSKAVDALIIIPNDRLVVLAGKNLTLRESFNLVDSVCLTAVRGISDLVMVPGLINVDFADVRSIMTGMGRALMGSGRGTGDKRALDAAHMAITSPLLEDVSIDGATGILVNISGGPDLTLAEVTEACSLVHEAADPDANIIFGSVIDPNLRNEVRITVIATGFQNRQVADTSANAFGIRPTPVKRMADNQMTLPITANQRNEVIPVSPFARVNEGRIPEVRSPVLPAFSVEAETKPFSQGTTIVGMPVSTHMETVDTAVDRCETEPPGFPQLFYPAGTPAPVVAQMTPPQSPLPPSYSESRPVIRPQVQTTVGTSASARRPPVPSVILHADAFSGAGDNEFDKPTYMRRALGSDGAGSLRSSIDGNKG
jgi:cell division protein FtsZ